MPENMTCTLLKHQVQGVHWLKDREKGKKKGGILADDVSRLPSPSLDCITRGILQHFASYPSPLPEPRRPALCIADNDR